MNRGSSPLDRRFTPLAQRKRIFVQLAAFAALLLGIGAVVLVFLLIRYTEVMQQVTVWLLQIGIAVFLVLAVFSLVAIVALIWTGGSSSLWDRVGRSFVVKLILPLAVATGRLLGYNRDQVQGSFIAINNTLLGQRAASYRPEDILVLLPRCLQWADCPHQVSQDITRCVGCGKCPIGDLIEKTHDLKMPMYVSTGGTQARRLVLEHRPRLIVAVACEREITEGIRDVGNIPVLGVLNDRPEGPCVNTWVDATQVANTIKRLIDPSASESGE